MSRIIRVLNICICLASLGLFVLLALAKTSGCLGTPMIQHLISIFALVLFFVSAMSIPARRFYFFGLLLLPEVAGLIFLALIPASDHYCVLTNLNALNPISGRSGFQQSGSGIPNMPEYQQYGFPNPNGQQAYPTQSGQPNQFGGMPAYDPTAGY